MHNVCTLQSEYADPYSVYARMRKNEPIYYDAENKIWAVYSFADCEQFLQNSASYIPLPQSQLNKHSELGSIVRHLARLSNGSNHIKNRRIASKLFSCWDHSRFDIDYLFQSLFDGPTFPHTFDWVNLVAKRLPALSLMYGFGIPVSTALENLPEIEVALKLMAPNDQLDEIQQIHESTQRIKQVFSQYVARSFSEKKKEDDRYFANFLGLLIQSFDATRGLLSNSLLHYVIYQEKWKRTNPENNAFISESARLNSTVQNTRRVLMEDTLVGNKLIKKGEHVLLVLGSANRDPKHFTNAETFVPERMERSLTFGSGIHQCIATNFSISLCSAAIHHFVSKHPGFTIKEAQIQYEPRVNVRLPKAITVKI